MSGTLRAIDLSGRQPAWTDDALKLWLECLGAAHSDARCFRTPPPAGVPELREAIAVWLSTSADQILVTPGVRAAAALVSTLGGDMLVERPGFTGVPTALASIATKVTLASWEDITSGAHGIEVGCPAVCWITSPCRNPDGAVAPVELVEAVGRLRDRGLLLVVNEVYREFAPAILRPDADLYVGSFAKVAGGGLRLGWVEGASGLVDELTRRQAAWPATAVQIACAAFLSRGGLDLLRPAFIDLPVRCREQFSEVAHEALGWQARAALGPFLTVRLADGEVRAGYRAFEHRGLRFGPGESFLADPHDVRLCFTDTSVAEACDAGEYVVAMHRLGLVDASPDLVSRTAMAWARRGRRRAR